MAISGSVNGVSDTGLPQNIQESHLTSTTAPTTKLFSLEDRTVVITGAGRGLGITLATAVLEAGGDAVCLDILPEPSKEEWAIIKLLQSNLNVSAIYLQCNVVDESAVSSALSQAAEHATRRNKPIRGLLHCAGIQQMIDAIYYPVDGFRRVLDVNVTGSFVLAKHTARLMREQGNTGSLVLIASMSGQIANRVSGLPCRPCQKSNVLTCSGDPLFGIQHLEGSSTTDVSLISDGIWSLWHQGEQSLSRVHKNGDDGPTPGREA